MYGRAQVGGKIFAAKYVAATGTWVLGVLWCVGEIDAIEGIWFNGAAAVAGVNATDYLGTTAQGVDPTLAAAISG